MTTAETTRRRLLVTSTVVNTIGNGAYLPTALLLLTTLTRLDLQTVGLVLTLAETVALVLMPLSGVLVDRIGSARTQSLCHAGRAVGFLAYPLTHSVWAFAAAAALVAAAERGSRVAGPALIADALRGAERDRYLALDRALSNAGLGAGGLVAAGLLALGTVDGYLIVAVTTAGAFALATIVTTRIRCATCAGARRVDEPLSWAAVLRNRRFRLLTLANTCASFGYVALAMMLPLYATVVLHLTPALGGALFTLNTVVVATLTVPVTALLQRRGVGGVRRARLGLMLMLGGFLVMAIAPWAGGTTGASVVLVTAVLLYTLGEIGHGPTATSLVLAAVPDAERGRYLGVYQMSWAVATAVAPAVFAALVTHHALLLLLALVLLEVVAIRLLSRSAVPVPVATSTTVPARPIPAVATTHA